MLKNNQKMSHLNFQAIDNFRISILKKNYAMIFLRGFFEKPGNSSQTVLPDRSVLIELKLVENAKS